MDERNKCFIDFYRFIDTIDINQIRFTVLIDISMVIFIDLFLRANWQQKTTLHVQHTFLAILWKKMSYVLTKDFDACVVAQSIPSVPIPPGICHFVLEKLGPLENGARKKTTKTGEAPHTNRP